MAAIVYLQALDEWSTGRSLSRAYAEALVTALKSDDSFKATAFTIEGVLHRHDDSFLARWMVAIAPAWKAVFYA